jgi:predicted dehydrogenase
MGSTGHAKPLRLVIIGAGSRGYARAIHESPECGATIAAVAEPNEFKRHELGRKYISSYVPEGQAQSFTSWQEFVNYEMLKKQYGTEDKKPGFDGVFICTLDQTHVEIITALAPYKLHIMSEKPLATNLNDCLQIYRAIHPSASSIPDRIFSIGHVLRYSPHNMLLKKLVSSNAIGSIISIEHTEPVGFWHFAHSYVRGNWRKESLSAPSLLTKSCHDIDFILWLLCEPSSPSEPHHLPSHITSSGSLSYFKKRNKPSLAGSATNCTSCSAEPTCTYSAVRIYRDRQRSMGQPSWFVKIVSPEIEDLYRTRGPLVAEKVLMKSLSDDYTPSTPIGDRDARSWYGRCVYESDNDVCDDQTVTIAWEESATQLAKTASFHMVAFTESQCERRGRIYGTKGEISYDSTTITVYDFATRHREEYKPKQMGGGHGGGDKGLADAFVKAIWAVERQGMEVEAAQRRYVGCGMEDMLRSHAAVFAAEEARRKGEVVKWEEWWERNVESVTRA